MNVGKFNISENIIDHGVDYTVRVLLVGTTIEDYEIYVDIFNLTEALRPHYVDILVQRAISIHESAKRGA